MPHYLVTGATGFIGPRLVAALQAAGEEVSCLVRPSSDRSALEPLGVRLVEGDVTQIESLPAALHGIDVVMHLAGRTFARNYAEFALVNATGVEQLAAACAQQKNPPVLVVTSSLAAAGPSPVGTVHRESDPAKPISHYGRSKLAGEQAARDWAAEVPISLVRPPVVFGPGDRAGLLLVRQINKTGLHVVHRPGLPLSLIAADDLADALLRVARDGERLDPTSPDGYGLYYAADPHPSSYTEMGRMVADALGRPLRVVRVRKWGLMAAAAGGELAGRLSGQVSVLNFDKAREATASGWVASSEKIGRQLQFQPATTLAERYRETIAWYRDAGWL